MLCAERVVFRDILRPIQVTSLLQPFGMSDLSAVSSEGQLLSRRGKEFPDVETYLRR